MEWANIVWYVVTGGAIAIAWIGKQIVEPWSTAYLNKSKADVEHFATVDEHLRNLDKAIVVMCEETTKQTPILNSIKQSNEQQEKVLKEMGSDNKKLCQADRTAEKLDAVIVQLKKLEAQGGVAAGVLLEQVLEQREYRAKEAVIAQKSLQDAGDQAITDCSSNHATCPLKQNK